MRPRSRPGCLPVGPREDACTETAPGEGTRLKIAIIGSGISGLTAAHLLHPRHRITLFEAAPRLGGHTHTHDVEVDGEGFAVDTGFIVYNERTYPGFVRLLDKLGVATQASVMSFGVSCRRTGLEYSATSLNTLFAQRRNLANLRFLKLIWEILRFNRTARRTVGAETLGAFLQRRRFSQGFVEDYLLPMGAAIWSTHRDRMLEFPAPLFIRFFDNHGLLTVNDQPEWRVVSGGSRSYVRALVAPFEDRIRTSAPVARVRRLADGGVEVKVEGEEAERFDEVVIAVHADQALAMLDEPTELERELLPCFPYQANEAILHTDRSLMPANRRAWASWNYQIPEREGERVTLTYDMSKLQGLASPKPLLVTLNQGDRVAPETVIERMIYHHPAYDLRSMQAQPRHGEVSGADRIHYCGAYWGYGFHEDGVQSALAACAPFGAEL